MLTHKQNIVCWFSLCLDVNGIAQDGEEKIEKAHSKIQELAEETSVALKKNVYKNYSQFIETAKEISSKLP